MAGDGDRSHRKAERHPPARRRGVRGDGPAGRLEDARPAERSLGLPVDGPCRPRGARAARPADASAHVGRARADGGRLPGLRRPPPRAPRHATRGLLAGPGRRTRRGRGRAPGDDRDALPGDAAARARLGAPAGGGDDQARRGAPAAGERRHGRGHHLDRSRLEAAARLPGACRRRARDVGGRVPQRASRGGAPRLARAPPDVRRAESVRARAVVPRHDPRRLRARRGGGSAPTGA